MSLFTALFDDAAVFPPGNLPLADAVPAHRRHRASWYADTVGWFVCPAARLDAVDVPVSAILSDFDVPEHPLLRAVEVAVPAGMSPAEAVLSLDDHLPAGVTGYLEVPRDERRPAILDLLAGTRLRAKFRTGGLRPGDQPGDAELAEAIHGCVARGLPFKCTAGLHHAVRGDQHGFLNVLAATDAAIRGAGPDELARLLGERDPARLVELAGRVTAEAREAFVSFGTCSISEPVTDLVALGLLHPVPERI